MFCFYRMMNLMIHYDVVVYLLVLMGLMYVSLLCVGVGWNLSLMLSIAGVRVVATSGGKDELERLQATAVEAGVAPADFLPVVCDLTKVHIIYDK